MNCYWQKYDQAKLRICDNLLIEDKQLDTLDAEFQVDIS